MQTTRQRCPIHNIPLARNFDLAFKKNDRVSTVRQINVTYHCRICRAKEKLEELRCRTVPKN